MPASTNDDDQEGDVVMYSVHAKPDIYSPVDAAAASNPGEIEQVAVPADVLAAAADLIGGRLEELHKAEARGYRRGRADTEAAIRRLAEETAAEPMDVDEPAPWPTSINPDLDRKRYPPNGRKRFAEPRIGDYQGGPLPLEHTGLVHLAGPEVHHHPPCAPECYRYKPGWYPPTVAVAILRRLPGNYADVIERLTAMADRKGGEAA